jgi:hypothetical protein
MPRHRFGVRWALNHDCGSASSMHDDMEQPAHLLGGCFATGQTDCENRAANIHDFDAEEKTVGSSCEMLETKQRPRIWARLLYFPGLACRTTELS